jgi:hypothetical protein
MKKLWILLLAFPVLFLTINSCENTSGDDDDSGADSTAILAGQVLNSETLEPIQQAIVMIMEYDQYNAYTDVYGHFEIEFELESRELIHLIAAPTSYIPDTLAIYVTPGVTEDSLRLRPIPTEETLLPSGEAASIILGSVNPPSIGVRESGSEEVATIIFVVQDSTGKPVDANHAVEVYFEFGGSPGGGLFLTPSSAHTNAVGEVTTYLFSGDSAGVVQIIARVNQPGLPIQSRPIAVAIHGGFPHPDHFGIAFNPLNIPGLIYYGVKSVATAYVGDKYGNPVKIGTNVYFTTTGGIIEGSSVTRELGQASADLISAEPNDPIHPVYGPGFAEVTARTVDENQNTIEISGPVLFSGGPVITLNDPIVNIVNGGSQFFSFVVSDINGNPMCSGQSIKISIESGEVKTIGKTSFTMDDTQSKTATYFSFGLEDAKPDSANTNSVFVSIETDGPNGKAGASITGTAE